MNRREKGEKKDLRSLRVDFKLERNPAHRLQKSTWAVENVRQLIRASDYSEEERRRGGGSRRKGYVARQEKKNTRVTSVSINPDGLYTGQRSKHQCQQRTLHHIRPEIRVDRTLQFRAEKGTSDNRERDSGCRLLRERRRRACWQTGGGR